MASRPKRPNPASKKPAKSKGAPAAKPAEKPAAAKSAASSAPRDAKKSAAKPATMKPSAKPVSKPAPKPTAATKPAAKPASKPVASKPVANKPASSKPAKPEPKAKVEAAKPPPKPAPAKPEPKPVDGKPARKGITIVTPKPARKPKSKPLLSSFPSASVISKPVATSKPLIASGPKSPAVMPLGSHHADGAPVPVAQGKSPFTKRELDKYRQRLLLKRAELVGDVSTLENEALKAESGSLSSLPQHMAEQGSETFDQTLTLDLAAADRRLIKEIDDALGRIQAGTYGVCMMTGKPIKPERLEELPWARYSIEAAREIERRGGSF